jgi:hypothetical protein
VISAGWFDIAVQCFSKLIAAYGYLVGSYLTLLSRGSRTVNIVRARRGYGNRCLYKTEIGFGFAIG